MIFFHACNEASTVKGNEGRYGYKGRGGGGIGRGEEMGRRGGRMAREGKGIGREDGEGVGRRREA